MNPGKCIMSTQVSQAVYDRLKASANAKDHTLSHHVATILRVSSEAANAPLSIALSIKAFRDSLESWVKENGCQAITNLHGDTLGPLYDRLADIYLNAATEAKKKEAVELQRKKKAAAEVEADNAAHRVVDDRFVEEAL